MASDVPLAGSPPHAGASSLAGRRFFCSWSGGKDAYLALQRATLQRGVPAALLCMLHEDGGSSRGHGLPLELLEEQAAALGIPLIARATTWDDYEATYVSVLHELRAQGVEAGVFGDIDLQAHRDWVEGVCETAGLSCHLPLWQEARGSLIDELLASGVRATVVAVDASRLDASFLGREVTPALVAELEAAGADACGEEGEYHTMVTEAPLFTRPVGLAWDGHVSRDGHWILEFTSAESRREHEDR
jgi:diphthine-ammonia ligase